MPHFLVAIHHPHDYTPAAVDAAMTDDIGALNRAMIAAGVRRWACGLSPQATSLRAGPDGVVLAADGAYLKADERVGGFWILECADFDEAVAWGRRAVTACRAPVEVRAVFQKPTAAAMD